MVSGYSLCSTSKALGVPAEIDRHAVGLLVQWGVGPIGMLAHSWRDSLLPAVRGLDIECPTCLVCLQDGPQDANQQAAGSDAVSSSS